MGKAETFTLVDWLGQTDSYRMFSDVLDANSAKSADHDLHYLQHLRGAFPELIVTAIPSTNVPLLAFAAAGFATYEVDKDTDSFASWRGYVGPSVTSPNGSLAENVNFAKYHYIWNNQNFILYTVGKVQYVLTERKSSENDLGPSKATDALIQAVGSWMLDEVVWVFDGYWYQDKKLFKEVRKMSWDKVILAREMKEELVDAAEKFFSSKEDYDDIGVPWKRGLLFHGPPGNGKTISIKALMNTLLERKRPIPTLYVKSAPQVFHINNVFSQARALAPCMLVLEDIETIVRPETRSYFFNQLDGLENNSGLFVVASTNFLDKLDPGLTKRPSRFDRKYLFPLPDQDERTLYCQFWRKKLEHKQQIEFPEKLCPAMGSITGGFSFAFLQECFVATLLYLLREAHGDDSNDDLDQYELWRVFKRQAAILRKEIGNTTSDPSWPHGVGAGPSFSAGGPCPDPLPGLSRPLALRSPPIAQGDSEGRLLPRIPYPGDKLMLVNSAAFEMK